MGDSLNQPLVGAPAGQRGATRETAEIAEVLWGMLTSPPAPQRQIQQQAPNSPISPSLIAASTDKVTPNKIKSKGAPKAVPPHIKKGKWTLQEDAKLAESVKMYSKNWKSIATAVGTRSPAQCLHRWKQSRDPSISHGKWTTTDDERLVQAVGRYGRQWARIAQEITGRTGAQCRERFCNKLDPTIYHGTWTVDMDNQLRAAVAQVGEGKWSRVASMLKPERTDYQARKRWKHLIGAGVLSNAATAAVQLELNWGKDDGQMK